MLQESFAPLTNDVILDEESSLYSLHIGSIYSLANYIINILLPGEMKDYELLASMGPIMLHQ